MTDSATHAPRGTLHASEIVGRRQIDVELGGWASFDVQISNSLHRHNFFEACLVTQGAGGYIHGQERFSLSAGDVFVSNPNVLHEISSRETRNLELFFVRFSIQELNIDALAVGDIYAQFEQAHRILAKTDGTLTHFVKLLESRCSDQAKLLVLFLSALLEPLLIQPFKTTKPLAVAEFDQIFAYIDANPDRTIRCGQLADLSGMSERTLRRRFHRATGCAIMDEVSHRRMRVAAHRLLGGMTVQEVADSLGGMDPAQFHRMFRRTFQIGPKAFQSTYVPGSLTRSTRP